MGRIRTIKPDFPHSESMGNISRDARLAFILLWTLADDEGRLRGSSRMLASLLFPYDQDASKLMEGWLRDLEKEGCILRYEVAGTHYLELCNWLKHQKIDHPGKSKIPHSSEASVNPREDSRNVAWDQGLRIKDQGRDQGSRIKEITIAPTDKSARALVTVPVVSDFDNFWSHYPCKKGKKLAQAAWDNLRKKGTLPALNDLLVAIDRQRGFKSWSDGYIPHPATWLNQERWTDEEVEILPPVLPAPKIADRSLQVEANVRAALAAVEERKLRRRENDNS